MNGVSVEFMTDTGCPTTIISEQTFKRLNIKINEEEIKHQVKTATGSNTKVLGYATVDLKLSNYKDKIKVIVVSDLVKSCLLGMDLLEACPLTKHLISELRLVLESKCSSNREIKKTKGIQIKFDKKIKQNLPVRIAKEAYETLNFFEELEDLISNVNSKTNSSKFEDPMVTKSRKIVEEILNIFELEVEEDEKSKISEEEKKIEDLTEKIIRSIKDICSDGLKDLKATSTIRHKIEVTNDTPFRERFRAVPHAKRKELKALIDVLINENIIVPSNSPYSSPTNIVMKPDGSIRLTVDYKRLNSVTIPDRYPLPIINDVLNDLIEAVFMSKLDLESGYYQIGVEEASMKFTAFACEWGLFEWTRLPMGLKNSGATFQRAMNDLLRPYIGKFCHVYMDDIIIYSKTLEEHEEHLQKVFNLIRVAQMKIKLKKCKFFLKEIEFLGHLISNGQLRPTKSKVEALFRYIRPKTHKQLVSFLGLASYYRKFIKDFVKIAEPLHACSLLKKKPVWTENCELAFNTLRTYLTESDKVLMLPRLDQVFKVFCDACDYGIGAVLSQEFVINSNDWRPIAYFSKHLSKAERNYSTGEKELLSIVWATENWKKFLYGVEFIVVTDHQPLQWLKTVKNPSSRLARWITRLDCFEFRIEYRKGSANGNADALSRWPLKDEDEEGENDFQDLIINNIITTFIDKGDKQIRIKAKIVENKKDKIVIDIEVLHICFRQADSTKEQNSDKNIKWAIEKLNISDSRPKKEKGNEP